MATVPERFAKRGDPAASIDDERGDLASLLELAGPATRRVVSGMLRASPFREARVGADEGRSEQSEAPEGLRETECTVADSPTHERRTRTRSGDVVVLAPIEDKDNANLFVLFQPIGRDR